MSIHIISLVLRKRWGGPTRKMVAIKLADVANEDGTSIYPSVRTIATEAEMSERQVQRVLGQFKSEGLLIVIREGVGRGITSEYRFDLSALHSLPDAKPGEDEAEAVEAEKGDTLSPFPAEKVTSATEKGDKLCHPTRPYPSFNKSTASGEAGAKAPPISKLVWDEALPLLLEHTQLSEPKARELIGSWFKRTSSDADKEKLLAIVRAAHRAGTGDPVSYIAKAVNETFPPPPDPKSFSPERWGFIARAVAERKEWDKRLGPPPGKRGCLMPAHLITPDLIKAINGGSASCRN